eukprot:sb/3479415/
MKIYNWETERFVEPPVWLPYILLVVAIIFGIILMIAGRYKKLKRTGKYTILNGSLLMIISFLWLAIILSWRSYSGRPEAQPLTIVLAIVCMVLFTLQSKWKITEIGICPGVIPMAALALLSTVLSHFIVWAISTALSDDPYLTVTLDRYILDINSMKLKDWLPKVLFDWLPKILFLVPVVWLWIGSRRLFSVYNVKGGRDYVFALIIMYAEPGIQIWEKFFLQPPTSSNLHPAPQSTERTDVLRKIYGIMFVQWALILAVTILAMKYVFNMKIYNWETGRFVEPPVWLPYIFLVVAIIFGIILMIAGRYKKLKRTGKYTILNGSLFAIISFLWLAIILSWRSYSGRPEAQPLTIVLAMVCMVLFTLQSKWKITEIGICPGVIPMAALALLSTVLSHFIVWAISTAIDDNPYLIVTFDRYIRDIILRMKLKDWLPKVLFLVPVVWLWIGSRRLFSVYNVKGGRDYVFALVIIYYEPELELLERKLPLEPKLIERAGKADQLSH